MGEEHSYAEPAPMQLAPTEVGNDVPEQWINFEYPERPADQPSRTVPGLGVVHHADGGPGHRRLSGVRRQRPASTGDHRSARRASGTDPAVLRRYLALQGTWSGLVAAVGMAAGLVLVPLLGDVIASDGRIDMVAFDLIVIVLVALTTPTLAAIVPTRDLARTSVLAALGGRRPIARVRPRQVRIRCDVGGGRIGGTVVGGVVGTRVEQQRQRSGRSRCPGRPRVGWPCWPACAACVR